MTNIFARITRRLALWAGRVRYELIKPTLSPGDVAGRLSEAAQVSAGDNVFFGAVLRRNLEMGRGSLRGPVPATDAGAQNGTHPKPPAGCDGVDWHVEPVFDVRWPPIYRPALSDSRAGSDMVLLFHKNKMMFLLDYAARCATTGDRTEAESWMACVDSWCRQNPYMVGMNWRSPMEIGTRLVVWSMGLHEMGDAVAPTEEQAARLVDSVIRQAEFLAGHFAIKPLPNNHLIGDAATLFAVATLWPVLSSAATWRAQAESILLEEARRQVLSDGVQFENALNYHTYVLDFYLLYLQAKANLGESPDAAVLDAVTRLARAQTILTSPRGRVPLFGDDSITEFFALRDADDLGTARFDGPVALADLVKPSCAAVLRDVEWGARLLATQSPIAVAHHFDKSGFSVVRSRRAHLVLSAGPEHDVPFNNGHVHSDGGSFELEIDGHMVFVDSGTWLYGYDDDARAHLRGASAHNAVVIDGCDPMTPSDRFAWPSVPRGRTLSASTPEMCAAMVCERPLPAAGDAGFTHRRMLVALDDACWICVDGLDGEDMRSHVAEIYLHTPMPGVDVRPVGAAVEMTTPVGRIDLSVAATAPVRTHLVSDHADRRCWYSPRYGELRRGTTVVVAVEFTGAVTAATQWCVEGTTARVTDIAPGVVSVAITRAGATHALAIDLGALTVTAGGEPAA